MNIRMVHFLPNFTEKYSAILRVVQDTSFSEKKSRISHFILWMTPVHYTVFISILWQAQEGLDSFVPAGYQPPNQILRVDCFTLSRQGMGEEVFHKTIKQLALRPSYWILIKEVTALNLVFSRWIVISYREIHIGKVWEILTCLNMSQKIEVILALCAIKYVRT